MQLISINHLAGQIKKSSGDGLRNAALKHALSLTARVCV